MIYLRDNLFTTFYFTLSFFRLESPFSFLFVNRVLREPRSGEEGPPILVSFTPSGGQPVLCYIRGGLNAFWNHEMEFLSSHRDHSFAVYDKEEGPDEFLTPLCAIYLESAGNQEIWMATTDAKIRIFKVFTYENQWFMERKSHMSIDCGTQIVSMVAIDIPTVSADSASQAGPASRASVWAGGMNGYIFECGPDHHVNRKWLVGEGEVIYQMVHCHSKAHQSPSIGGQNRICESVWIAALSHKGFKFVLWDPVSQTPINCVIRERLSMHSREEDSSMGSSSSASMPFDSSMEMMTRSSPPPTTHELTTSVMNPFLASMAKAGPDSVPSPHILLAPRLFTASNESCVVSIQKSLIRVWDSVSGQMLVEKTLSCIDPTNRGTGSSFAATPITISGAFSGTSREDSAWCFGLDGGYVEMKLIDTKDETESETGEFDFENFGKPKEEKNPNFYLKSSLSNVLQIVAGGEATVSRRGMVVKAAYTFITKNEECDCEEVLQKKSHRLSQKESTQFFSLSDSQQVKTIPALALALSPPRILIYTSELHNLISETVLLSFPVSLVVVKGGIMAFCEDGSLVFVCLRCFKSFVDFGFRVALVGKGGEKINEKEEEDEENEKKEGENLYVSLASVVMSGCYAFAGLELI